MSKGYFLGKLLGIGENIHQQMMQVFADAGVEPLDLKGLPEDGKQKWMALFEKSKRVSKMMTDLILSNDKRYLL